VDQLHAGLVEPSDTHWIQGADALLAAPLKRKQLPGDRRLTPEVFAAEARVHDLAARARGATSREQRIDTYAAILATCADCHRLHQDIWGPAPPPD
jgi:hypothetical protein